jgi:hypothetical protein
MLVTTRANQLPKALAMGWKTSRPSTCGPKRNPSLST